MKAVDPSGEYTVARIKHLVKNTLIFISRINMYVLANRQDLASLNGSLLGEKWTLTNDEQVTSSPKFMTEPDTFLLHHDLPSLLIFLLLLLI